MFECVCVFCAHLGIHSSSRVFFRACDKSSLDAPARPPCDASLAGFLYTSMERENANNSNNNKNAQNATHIHIRKSQLMRKAKQKNTYCSIRERNMHSKCSELHQHLLYSTPRNSHSTPPLTIVPTPAHRTCNSRIASHGVQYASGLACRRISLITYHDNEGAS